MRAWPTALAAAALVGAVSLAAPATLGYDPWAWMVWGRELAHLDLATTGGPSWKPLPPLVLAPLSVLGGAAPYVWLALMRAAGVVAVVAAFRIAARIAGPVAGTAAALALILTPDLYRTAVSGSSEPLLVALVLGAVDRHLARRHGTALVLVALAALLRPEAWPFLILYGAWTWRACPGLRRWAVVLVVAPVLVWLGLDWAGSGGALHGAQVAQDTAEGSAAHDAVPALEVLRRGTSALLWPTFVLLAAGVALAVRRRDRLVLGLTGIALAWVTIVAVMAQDGYPGLRRYLVAPAALACVIAGVGLVWLLQSLAGRRSRIAVAVVVGVVALLPGLLRAREDARIARLAGRQAAQTAELRRAVAAAGGPAAVLAVGRPVVNAWLQTALAWQLHAPLGGVQATWSSSRRRPHWAPPALVFRAPSRLAGPRPAIPTAVSTRTVASAGRWRVLQAGR